MVNIMVKIYIYINTQIVLQLKIDPLLKDIFKLQKETDLYTEIPERCSAYSF